MGDREENKIIASVLDEVLTKYRNSDSYAEFEMWLEDWLNEAEAEQETEGKR